MAIIKPISKLVLVLIIYFLSPLFVCAQKSEPIKKVVPAIVINADENSNVNDISELNGEQIIALIDSLLMQDRVSDEMLNQLSDYAENKRLHEDIYVSLTGFYDSSLYPSNSFYNKWDTYRLFNEVISDLKVGESRKLTLEDTVNECRFYNPFKGLITSNFGWRDGRPHNGIDLSLIHI